MSYEPYALVLPEVGAPAARPGRIYFHTLSGMRGVAALFIVVFHLTPYFRPISVPLGYAAVDLFFLLSGAVIEASYGDKLRGGLSFANFARIRLARLYPLYILGTLITLAAIAVAPHGALHLDSSPPFTIPSPSLTFIPAALFLPIFGNAFMYPLNPPAWSLFWELVVNFIYAVLLPYLNRKRLVLLIVATGWPFAIAAYFGGERAGGPPILGFAHAMWTFFLGVLIYRERAIWTPKGWAVKMLPWTCVIIVAVALGWRQPTPAAYPMIIFLVFPIVVGLALHAQPSRRCIPLFDFAGDVSYPMYAIHMPLAVLILAFTGPLIPVFWLGLTFSAVLIILARILNQYYDRPFRRLLMGSANG